MCEIGEPTRDRNGFQYIPGAPEIYIIIPIRRPAKQGADGTSTGLLNDLCIVRASRAVVGVTGCHLIAIHNVNSAFLTSLHYDVGKRPGLIGQQKCPAGTQVHIIRIQCRLVLRSKVVEQRENLIGSSKFQQSVARFTCGNVYGIEIAVAAGDVDIPGRIRSHTCSGHPQSAEASVGSRDVNALLRERRRVVSKEPTMIRAEVAMRTESDVNCAVHQQKAGSILLV